MTTQTTAADQHTAQLDAKLAEMFADNASWNAFQQKYEVIEEDILGRGGEGTVHKIRDRDSGDLLAAKVISMAKMSDWGELRKLQRQAEVLEGLDHHAILKYVGYHALEEENRWGSHDYEYILVTELVDTPTLATTKKKFSEAELVSIRDQVLGALQYCHERGIIHRDIKPGNIAYDEETGKIKLLDFGIAKQVGQTTNFSTMGSGTVNYMAPEQANGGTVPESDLYGLGATLITLARGKEYEKVVGADDLKGYVNRLKHLSKEFRNGLQKLVDETPANRKKIASTKRNNSSMWLAFAGGLTAYNGMMALGVSELPIPLYWFLCGVGGYFGAKAGMALGRMIGNRRKRNDQGVIDESMNSFVQKWEVADTYDPKNAAILRETLNKRSEKHGNWYAGMSYEETRAVIEMLDRVRDPDDCRDFYVPALHHDNRRIKMQVLGVLTVADRSGECISEVEKLKYATHDGVRIAAETYLSCYGRRMISDYNLTEYPGPE